MSPQASTELTAYQEKRIQQIGAAREDLLDFSVETYRRYQKAPHLRWVADELQTIERTVVDRVFGRTSVEVLEPGYNDRLIIEMPPRHGKSELVSVRFPAWAICRNPWLQFISASYGDDLATEMGRKARNTITAQEVFPNLKLRRDSQAKNLWHTTEDGQFLAVGIGSGVVGFGGHIITIDDPFKKREEAESLVLREKIWNWYSSEILTRQEPGAAIVVVMHRWHEDDLIGRLLEQDAGSWRVIRLPALAEPDDPLGREVGEALWPSRYPRKVLERRRAEVLPRDWASLYQQRPAPEEGHIFQWFPTYEPADLAAITDIVIGIDTAYTRKKASDFTAYAAWGTDRSRAFLLEAGRTKAEAPVAERNIVAFYNTIKQRWPGKRVIVVYRVSVAIDRVAAQHLRAGVAVSVPGRREGDPPQLTRVGVPVQAVKTPAGNSKEELAVMTSSQFEGGRALIPKAGPRWLAEWKEEHITFPGLHDDFVETTLVAHYKIFHQGVRGRKRSWQLWDRNA